jgi:FkbM family methyltransferase
LDIYRYSPTTHSSPLNFSLQRFGIDLVLDVGANQGQFASEIRRGGYTGNIVSFEPLTDAHGMLLQVAHVDKKWEVFPRCAIGNRNGEVEINIAGNSLSSSILPMLESHRVAAPDSIYLGQETAPIHTLDSVGMPYLKKSKAPFLKIDTQGLEWQVLDGARISLARSRGVLIELSLVPLYEGQHMWLDIVTRMEAEGFILWAFAPVFSDPEDGRTLQVDGVFYRA